MGHAGAAMFAASHTHAFRFGRCCESTPAPHHTLPVRCTNPKRTAPGLYICAALACRAVSKEELAELLRHSEFANKTLPILFLANKCDLPHSLSHEAIAEAMQLAELAQQHNWTISKCCGVTGEGVREGWDWLTLQIAQSARYNHNR